MHHASQRALDFFKKLTPAKRNEYRQNYLTVLSSSDVEHMHAIYEKGLQTITALMIDLGELKIK